MLIFVFVPVGFQDPFRSGLRFLHRLAFPGYVVAELVLSFWPSGSLYRYKAWGHLLTVLQIRPWQQFLLRVARNLEGDGSEPVPRTEHPGRLQQCFL